MSNAQLSFAEVASRLDVHASTVNRWVHRGVRGVRLPATIVGGRFYVEEKRLDEFLESIQAVALGAS